MVEKVKERKVNQTDWDKVETYVNDVFQQRQTSTHRKEHERIWKEVDRQILMKPLQRVDLNGRPAKASWHNAIELGELAKASEIITDDVMRIIFPQDRSWFSPHTEIQWPTGQDGKPQVDSAAQTTQDGLLRNFMAQQHKDFGLKARFQLSIKEALHHGSFAAEVRFEDQMMIRNGKVKKIGAPVWVPYSMWNTYPDPSPAVVGTNMFYTGSMILVEYVSMAVFKRMGSEGWMQSRMKKVEKQQRDTEKGKDEVELVKFKGDISIERSDGDIYLPNSEVIIANGKVVFYQPAELPYPNVIFGGYERQDVRDPYYTSPIIKQSPTHRMTTIVANKFLDAVSLKVEPPIEYDGNDPDYVANDGPVIAPGVKTPTRSMGKGFTPLDIGDPRFALDAYTLGLRQMQEGLGVSAMRSGVRETDRETATSANLANQGAEVRTMGFIAQLEPQGLLPFLYMQHEYNRAKLEDYTFYNDEMHTPDFLTINRSKLQEDVHFDVTGSRGVLGEEKRDRKVAETTAFFSGNPLFAPKLDVKPIMLEMYRDAGKKNPEEWVKDGEDKPQIPPELQQQIQQMQQEGQKLQQENQMLKSKTQTEVAKLQADMQQFQQTLANEREQFAKDYALRVAEFRAEVMETRNAENADREKTIINLTTGDEINKATEGLQNLAREQAEKIAELSESLKEMNQSRKARGKMKATRTKDGFDIDDMKIIRTDDGYEIH